MAAAKMADTICDEYRSGNSPAVGMRAPDFELSLRRGSTNGGFRTTIGNVGVLLFYPQNETLVCTKQLCSVRDNWQDYLETKAEIVGISPVDVAGES